jgi:predicted acylesterase/phospholipase RssA
LYSGEKLYQTIDKLLRNKTGINNTTFAQLKAYQEREKLKERKLVVTATCLATQELVWFSYETTPDVAVATAVQASSALPLFFEPVKLEFSKTRAGAAFERTCVDKAKVVDKDKADTSPRMHHLWDGGLLANLPWAAFDNDTVTPHRPQSVVESDPTAHPPRNTIVAERRPSSIAGIHRSQHDRKRQCHPCVPHTRGRVFHERR